MNISNKNGWKKEKYEKKAKQTKYPGKKTNPNIFNKCKWTKLMGGNMNVVRLY
jgi:hypothetical protein